MSTPEHTPDITSPGPSPSADMKAGIEGGLTITAFDLDRTLIYSASSQGDAATLPPLRVVEHFEGEPLSRMTKKAWTMLDGLMDLAKVVPVTTRTQAQYERVHLPQTPHYAICANGGILLIDGVRDPAWDTWTRKVIALSAPLVEMAALMEQVADEPWVKKVRVAEDLFCYLVASHRRDIPGKWLRKFTEQANDMGWSVSVQGRKVYAVPEGLSKASALMRLRDLLDAAHDGPVQVYSTGDSLLDGPMMEASDAAIRPAHGELHDQGWDAHGVAVTSLSGAMAGEQIIEWMTERAHDAAPTTDVARSAAASVGGTVTGAGAEPAQ